MSNQISTAFVKQFTDGITLLAQQRGSRLREGVTIDSGITGDRSFYDQIGATAAVQKTSRHGDTPLVETPHSRRMLTLSDWEWAELISDADKLKVLNDPTNAYSQHAAFAMGRTMDTVIRDAFFGTASTGVDGSGTAAFDTTNYRIAHGGAGLTIAKLREAREILESAENMEDKGEYQWYIAVTAHQKRDLLATTEVTSSDFNTVKALVGGSIEDFLGFKFVDYQGLALDSTTRSCPAWCKSSMKLGVGAEPKGDIGVRRDKSLDTQVYYQMSIGATRLDETGVVEVQCTES